MTQELEVSIEFENAPFVRGRPIWISVVVMNQTDSTVSLVNPDVGKIPEELNWSFTKETFQIAMLLSIHLIEMCVTNSRGESLPQVGPHSWATPLLMPRLELAPGDSLRLRINLSDHFHLEADKYHVAVEYGDERASARGEVDLLIQ